MQACFQNNKILKTILETTSEMSADAKFVFNEMGFSFQALDASHVCLSSLQMDQEDFKTYSITESISFGISLVNLLKIVKCSNPTDTVVFEYPESNGAKCTVQFTGSDRKMTFELNTMEIDQELLEAPETVYLSNFELPSEKWKQVMNDSNSMGSACSFTVGSQKLFLSVDGDMGKLTTEIPLSKDTEPVESTSFSTRHLLAIAKAAPLAEKVQISLAKDMPLIVQYKFGNASRLTFYLAPKIQT